MNTTKSMAKVVYDEIKRRILSKEYRFNEHVTEKHIAWQLNVSKTPVREALGQLCNEGYMQSYPNMGYIIKDLNYQEIRDISELRVILETAAICIIAQTASDEEIRRLYEFTTPIDKNVKDGYGGNTLFHWELGKLTKNAYMADYVHQLAMSVFRPSSYLQSEEGEKKPSDYYHRSIVDALVARDVDTAVRFLRMDVLTSNEKH